MLVVMMNNQLLAPDAVCQGCLMADQAGQPRWRQGQLRCGRLLAQAESGQPTQYECQMGFRIAHIE
ncbi:MAG: hypothetical protein O3C67_01950 [Cyanobacteria bacterium]|nr:hypothetical protein [Cyanobacteriota bacterium]